MVQTASVKGKVRPPDRTRKLPSSETAHERLLSLGVKHLVEKRGMDEASARRLTEQYLQDAEEAEQLVDFARQQGWAEIVEAWEAL